MCARTLRSLVWRALLGLVLSATFGLASAPTLARAESDGPGFDLEGTWYVLVHYKDSETENADATRWEDRVWVFKRSGNSLSWTDYPIVVFGDNSGRFEVRGANSRARVLDGWEPNAAQRAQIRAGLEINTRGSKRKKLRGSDARGYKSLAGSGSRSASVIGYQETWLIDDLATLPVFERRDLLGGSARVEGVAGLTRYATREIRRKGRELVGDFVRDENRRGTFTLYRAGDVRSVGTRKTQAERSRAGLAQQATGSEDYRRRFGYPFEQRLLRDGVSLSEPEHAKVHDRALGMLLQGRSDQGVVEKLYGEVRDRFYSFAPRMDPAEPRSPVRYAAPLAVPLEAVGSENRETSAYHFAAPAGTPVLAARAGKVERVVSGYGRGGIDGYYAGRSNTIVVLHDDGSFASYSHLSKAGVEVGESVSLGQRLGESGLSGQLEQPGLGFAVRRLDAGGTPGLVPIRFDVPVDGHLEEQGAH